MQLAGLGDLGDNTDGTGALTAFRGYLETYISAKAGPAYLQNAKAAPTLIGSINLAATAFTMGEAGTLQPDAQAYWNQWHAQSYDPSSPDNVGYLFGKLIAGAQTDLVNAASLYGSWWTDPAASAASFTLMDTSQSGTTWYGGTTVQSALSNDQWNTIFIKGFAALMKGITKGVLPITYLQVFCGGLLQQPAARRMPVFLAPPGNLTPTDPQQIAFRTCMKQLGWNDIIDQWFSYTQQAWAAQNAAYESQDSSYGSAITVLSYTSGEKILEQIQAKMQDYWDARAQAAQAITDFNTIVNGPMGDQVTDSDKAAMAAIVAQYQSVDQTAYSGLANTGLWDPSKSAGGLSGLGILGFGRHRGLAGLGAVQLILAGILAVTALGIIAYVVTLMSKVGRDAAAQTKATADSILGTVSDMKDSCQRVYDGSAKGPDDETALQQCLAQTQSLYNSIPKPPDAGDPLGLKWIALVGAVGVAGLIAVMTIKGMKKGG